MRPADKVLLHQAQPAKIAGDVAASMVSNVLLWKAQPKAAVVACEKAVAAAVRGYQGPPLAQAPTCDPTGRKPAARFARIDR